MNRRDLLAKAVAVSTGAVAGAAISACGAGNSGSASGTTAAPKHFLFVHGAWHNSLHWNKVMGLLAADGHNVVAIDLPGYGLNASFPNSYLEQNAATLPTEVSPIANITLQNWTDSIVNAVESLAPRGKVTLVGRSAGGIATTQAAESVPTLLQRIVYLTAFCPSALPSINAYSATPQGASGLTGTVLVGDPTQIGAFRINPRSTDTTYIEALRLTFYNDVTTAQCLPYVNPLTSDFPYLPATEDARGTAAKWGSVPRTFIRCLQDHAIPLALQDLMIAQADALTPNNKFDQQTLNSSHCAFASMPEQVAAIFSALA